MALSIRLRVRPFRLLLVTFDLTNTTPGDPRYRAADDAMAAYGQLFKPIKQLRLLITRRSAKRIKDAIQQRIGRDASVLITPINALPAWRIHGRAKQAEWRRLVAALSAQNVEISGLAETIESTPA